MTRSPSLPYVAPFAVFLALLALHSVVVLPDLADQVLRVAVMTVVLAWSVRAVRHELSFEVRSWAASALIGVLVFAIWIGPDLLFPAYRKSWLFQNAIMGSVQSSLSTESQSSVGVLTLRTIRAAAIVPVAEELFWRVWLMRWIIQAEFLKLPLGTYTPRSFWIVALLFASEHGAYWDVGLAAGVIYNWWMIRRKSAGDLILAHAVTNLCLSVYVITLGKWEYWL